ncbi:MAG: class I SAM-dependent methyltransferase [Symploca sp. SIO2E9]|nr:class I SAM-dependent methyltransferase [Symploca sp. SIO2E9]
MSTTKDTDNNFHQNAPRIDWNLKNSKTLFSLQSDSYDEFRQQQPEEIILELVEALGLEKGSRIADIGAGPAREAEILAYKLGYKVIAVEPADGMRKSALRRIAKNKNIWAEPLNIIDGKSDDTHLPDNSIDLVLMGNSSHWFISNLDKTTQEFARILKNPGNVALFYTLYDQESELITSLHNVLSQHCSGYSTSRSQVIRSREIKPRSFASHYIEDSKIREAQKVIRAKEHNFYEFCKLLSTHSFFPKRDVEVLKFIENQQAPELITRSSIIAKSEENSLLVALNQLFDQYAEKEKLTISWQTTLHYGQLKEYQLLKENIIFPKSVALA